MSAVLGVRTLAPPSARRAPGVAGSTGSDQDLIAYYTEVGPDFGAWSRNFNMHFGFWRWGLRPWRREPMLEQMNAEVFRRLSLDLSRPRHLLDLGCGLGATARSFGRRSPSLAVTGVTLVPWQIDQARRLTEAAGLADRVHFVRSDYRALPQAARSVDGAYAIESACHATGPAKADFLEEAARVLRPGGRLVVADAFLKHGRPLPRLLRPGYDLICRGWCVDGFAQIEAFRGEAERLGFRDVRVEDISWRVAPSALFVPLVTARFLWTELAVRRARLTPRRWGNALAPMMGTLLGAARTAIGYYLVTAVR